MGICPLSFDERSIRFDSIPIESNRIESNRIGCRIFTNLPNLQQQLREQARQIRRARRYRMSQIYTEVRHHKKALRALIFFEGGLTSKRLLLGHT